MANGYLTFKGTASFTLKQYSVSSKTWDGTLEYSTNGSTWTTWSSGATTISSSSTAPHVLYLRGTGNTKITGNSNNYTFAFTTTGKIDCIGRIDTLLDYQTVLNGGTPTMASSCYKYMFASCTSLTSAPALPATTLASSCYQYMFSGCTSLTSAPALPATTLANYCYADMFYACTFLTSAPALPATTLASYCYADMFYECTSLTSAPALPATTLASSCYRNMFRYCNSLTSAPALPATTLADNCYEYMFSGCTSIKLSTTQDGVYKSAIRIPSTGTGTAGSDSLSNMFSATGGSFTGTPTINTTYYIAHAYVNNITLNAKWIENTSMTPEGLTAGKDSTGYVTENISRTLGNLVHCVKQIDSNKLDTSTVSTTGSYGTAGWSECKLVDGKIKYYYTSPGPVGSYPVTTYDDNSSKLYLTGSKFTGTDTDYLYKNTSVYEQSGVICAPEVNANSLVLNDSRPKNLLRYKPRKYGSNGITVVSNYDGSITVSGTATARTVYTINIDKSIIPGAGTYVLSSGGVSTSSSTYWVEAYIEYDSSSSMTKQTYTNGTYVQFTLSTNTIRNVTIYIIVASGKTCNQTFKPMLCTLDDWNKSTTFYPPAVSINELYTKTQTVSSMYPTLDISGSGAGGLNFQPENTTWCGTIASGSSMFPGQYAISRVYPLNETGSSRCHIIELANGGKLTRYYDGSAMSWSDYVLTPYVQQYVRSDVATSSASLSDTGVSVTLQEIGTYRITATVLYVYAEPVEVALYNGNNCIAHTSGTTNVTDLFLTASGFIRATSRNSTTVKLYAKTNSSSTNRVTLMAEHVSLNY